MLNFNLIKIKHVCYIHGSVRQKDRPQTILQITHLSGNLYPKYIKNFKTSTVVNNNPVQKWANIGTDTN